MSNRVRRHLLDRAVRSLSSRLLNSWQHSVATGKAGVPDLTLEHLEPRQLLSVSLVKNIAAGAADSNISELTNVKGVAYFAADDGVHGKELWKSDGTAAGTVMVKDIAQGADASWPANLTNMNGVLYFSAADGNGDRELWKSDGTAAGTVLVKDIFSGGDSSDPGDLMDVNGTLFFVAEDGIHGGELWKSDGTAAGTVMVKDIAETSGDCPTLLTPRNGKLFFWVYGSGNGSLPGMHVWMSNGTEAGTVPVMDFGEAAAGMMASADSGLYGRIDDLARLFSGVVKFDETGGTPLDIYTGGTYDSAVTSLFTYNGAIYFTVENYSIPSAPTLLLYTSGGTAASTVVVKSFPRLNLDEYGFEHAVVNGILYFAQDDVADGRELWRSDGTTTGTYQVSDINPLGDSNPRDLRAVGGYLYFTASADGQTTDWYRSDGTPAGTVLLSSEAPAVPSASAVNNTFFFTGYDEENGSELWAVGPRVVGLPVAESYGTPEGHFYIETGPQRLVFDFSESVQAQNGAVALHNLSTGEDITGLVHNEGTTPGTSHTWRVTTTGTLGEPNALIAGNYDAVLDGDRVSASSGGDKLNDGNDYLTSFFFLPGDLNHNRVVNDDDLDLWELGFTTSESGYHFGDVDYDDEVTYDDYDLINSTWGTALPAPPTAANSLVAYASIARGRIDLNWVPPTAEVDGYHIYRSSNGGASFTLHATVNNPLATHWYETGLADGAKYVYRLRPFTTAGGEGQSTNKAWAVTNLPMPENLTSTDVTADSVTLTWEDGSNNEDGYEVWMRAGEEEAFVKIADATELSENECCFVVPDLEERTAYTFTVRAVTAAQTSMWAPEESVVIIQSPEILDVTDIGDSSVVLHWRDLSGVATSYQVYVAEDEGGFEYLTTLSDAALTSEDDSISATIDGLPIDASIALELRALGDSQEQSPRSPSLEFATLPAGVPGNARATARLDATEIGLDWTASGAGVSGYHVYRSEIEGGGFDLVATLSSSVSEWTDSDVDPGVRYFYKIASYSGSTDLAEGEIVSATPIVAAPTALTAQVINSTKTRLNWTAVSGTTYEVWRSTAGAPPVLLISNLAAGTYDDAAVVAGVKYVYRIRAVQGTAKSRFSATAGLTYQAFLDVFDEAQYETGTANGEPAIKVPVDQSIHVNAWNSVMGPNGAGADLRDSGALTLSQITWNFGDVGSQYNILPGFNAGHVYDTQGTYRIDLTIINKDGQISTSHRWISVVDNSYNSTTDGQQHVIYVSGPSLNPSTTGNGALPTTPVTWARAITVLESLRDDTRVYFHRGDVINAVDATGATKTWNLKVVATGVPYRNVFFGNYKLTTESDSLAAPVIKLPSTATDRFTAIFSSNVPASQIHFDGIEIYAPDGIDGVGDGIGPSGGSSNWIIQDVSFIRLDAAIKNALPDDNATEGLLVIHSDSGLNNGVPQPLGDYFYYNSGGHDIVFLGNSMGDLKTNHNTRMYRMTGGLFFDNKLRQEKSFSTNTDLNTFRFNLGSYGWFSENTTTGGLMSFGRTGSDTNDYTVHDVVVENNRVFNYANDDNNTNLPSSRVTLGDNLTYAVVRNNYFERNDHGVLDVQGDTKFIHIVNNTAVNVGTEHKGFFIRSHNTQEGIVLRNNLYIAENIALDPNGNPLGWAVDADAGLTEYSEISRNFWDVQSNPSPGSETPFVAGTLMFSVGDQPKDLANYWNKQTSIVKTPGDTVGGMDLDDEFMPTSGSADRASGFPGWSAKIDLYGNPRPNTGTWSVGAVQRPFDGGTAMFYGPYTSQDINTSLAGSTVVGTPNSSYDVTADGADIFGASDGFRFVERKVTGDFDIKTQVVSFTGTNINSAAKAGLMARETLNANSFHATIAATPAGGFKFIFRDDADGPGPNPPASSVSTLGLVSYQSPYYSWVRLKRIGALFVGYYSTDGSNWVEMGRHRFAFGFASTPFVGMAVSSHSTGEVATAKFRNLDQRATGFGALTIQRGRFDGPGDNAITVSGDTTSLSLTADGETIVYSNISSLVVDADAYDYLSDPSGDDTLTVNVTSGVSVVFKGGLGADVLYITGGSYTFASDPKPDTDALAVYISGSSTNVLFNSSARLGALNISGGTTTLASGGNKVLFTKSLTMSSTGKLDLTDEDMVIDYTSSSPIGTWNGSNYTANSITRYVKEGRNGGGWNGNGIVTSMTLAQPANARTTLGIAEATAVLNFNGASTVVWNGQTVDTTAVIVKYTYAGDANLSGRITGEDYDLIDAGYLAGATGYYNGDFNYDGVIDADDYWLINHNYSYSQPPNPQL